METSAYESYIDNTVETRQIVGFRLENEEFGIDIMSIQEINRISTITRVPNAQRYVVGVINLRGKIVPVIDLRLRMGMPASVISEHSRIIVAEVGGKVVGFIVDEVRRVMQVPVSSIDIPPKLNHDPREEYITGIAKLDEMLLTLVDIASLLTHEEAELAA